MKALLAVVLVGLALAGCRGPKSAEAIREDVNAMTVSSVKTGSRGVAHQFDFMDLCELCGKDRESCATCESCPVASEGFTGKEKR